MLKKGQILFILLLNTAVILFFANLSITHQPKLATAPMPATDHSSKNVISSLGSNLSFEFLKHEKLIFSQKRSEITNPEKIVYLTFDDGPSIYTDDIVSILQDYQIRGTFFLLQPNMVVRPDAVSLLNETDQSIGCHGVTHQVPVFYSSAEAANNEMSICEETLKQNGVSSKLIRLPYGSYPYLTKDIQEKLTQSGYIYWDWNIDSVDWKQKSSDAITKTVINQVKAYHNEHQSIVILMHEKLQTIEALPNIIEALSDQGFVFEKINEKQIPVQFRLSRK